MMTAQIHRTELEDPTNGRWANLELEVSEGVVVSGIAEAADLPLLRETFAAVLAFCGRRRVTELLDLSATELERALGPSVQRRRDDVEFALLAVHRALLGQTH